MSNDHGKRNTYDYWKCRCKLCTQASQDYLAQRRKKNNAVLNKIKRESGCVDCGYTAHAVALDFDHLNPEDKTINIGEYNGSLAIILTEIKKCEVVCANCHRVRTAQRGGWYGYEKPEN